VLKKEKGFECKAALTRLVLARGNRDHSSARSKRGVKLFSEVGAGGAGPHHRGADCAISGPVTGYGSGVAR
jgi:hypothetical protein